MQMGLVCHRPRGTVTKMAVILKAVRLTTTTRPRHHVVVVVVMTVYLQGKQQAPPQSKQ